MKTVGPKREEVTGEWRKLRNEELNDDLYCSQNILRVIKSRRMVWQGQVALYEEDRCRRFWWGRPQGKRPLVRPRRR